MQTDLAMIKTILQTTPARWVALTAALPANLLNARPAEGEWSALECLVHILDTEAVFQTRLQAFLSGQDFPGFNPDAQGTKLGPETQATELAARLDHLRQTSLAALASITPADLERTARHAELGRVTLSQMVNEWATHDLNHTIQAEQALIQPFIAQCGPWQIYFQDQVIKK
jgi:uncharacterized damage-inducible protein DinB